MSSNYKYSPNTRRIHVRMVQRRNKLALRRLEHTQINWINKIQAMWHLRRIFIREFHHNLVNSSSPISSWNLLVRVNKRSGLATTFLSRNSSLPHHDVGGVVSLLSWLGIEPGRMIFSPVLSLFSQPSNGNRTHLYHKKAANRMLAFKETHQCW